jgi:hypothetical protein
MPELALDHPKRVLHLGSDDGLHVFQAIHQSAQRRCLIQRPALARAHGHVPVGLDALRLFSLAHALVARIGEHISFLPVHQLAGLRHIAHIGGCAHHRVHQPRVGVHADVSPFDRAQDRLHPKVPLINDTSSAHGTTKFISSKNSRLRVLKIQALESRLTKVHLFHDVKHAGSVPEDGFCRRSLGSTQ